MSVHFNAYGDGSSFNSAEGVGTYIHSKASRVGDSKKLAEYVQKNLVKGTKQKNRGINTAELAMCNCTSLGTKASILVELAFMTNLHEATNLMGNSQFWQECAEEICKGICEMEGKTYIAKSIKDENKGEQQTIYRVQIGAYISLKMHKNSLTRRRRVLRMLHSKIIGCRKPESQKARPFGWAFWLLIYLVYTIP